MRSFRLWVPLGIGLLLVALAVPVLLLVPRALAAKDALLTALPLAEQVKEQVMHADPAAHDTALRLSESTARAAAEADGALWRALEWVPMAGPNLEAVRVAAASTDALTREVLLPVSTFSLQDLKPVDGAINLEAFGRLRETVDAAEPVAQQISAELSSLDTGSLIGQVRGGVEKLEGAVAKLSDMLEPARTALQIIPPMLGENGPQHTLMIFQNNAEVRTTGGNPAAIILLNGDGGRISIAQQASSASFVNNRPEPIIPLNPVTQEIYGSRVGEFVQDITYTPDFAETASLARAFWADSFGEHVDTVISFDPVALSYLLDATGPVALATGDVLTVDNAVQLLLNEVYKRYPNYTDGKLQDAFFAAATQSIFEALSSGNVDTGKLFAALARAAEEGRLMYNTPDTEKMALLVASAVGGPLPADNTEDTVLGVFVNDQTGGKMQYYLENAVEAASTQCLTDDAPAVFTATAHVHNLMSPEEFQTVGEYIRVGGPGLRGANFVDLIFYGPVGTTFDSFTSEGAVGDHVVFEHLGRPAIKILVMPEMLQTVSVTAKFTAAADQPGSSFGPFEVRTTPLAHETLKTVSTPGCK